MITSSANPHLKLMRSLSRRRTRRIERAFLVEGRRLIEDAAGAGISVRSLLVRDDVDLSWAVRLGIDPENLHIVAAAVFDASSDVEHSQGIAGVCSLPDTPDAGAFDGGDMLIIDQLRDPGNMGTALRSAAASGISTVLVTDGSVDPYSPKVVRSGMGAHFRLNIGHFDEAWAELLRCMPLTVVFSDMLGEVDYDAFDWSAPFVLVLGGETEKLSLKLGDLINVSVRIPMARNVESLNAGVAASIVMFEAARQRRVRDLLG